MQYTSPDLVKPALKEATRVRGGRGAAMKWLGQPCERLDGRVPIEMLDSNEGADALAAYMAEWAAQNE